MRIKPVNCWGCNHPYSFHRKLGDPRCYVLGCECEEFVRRPRLRRYTDKVLVMVISEHGTAARWTELGEVA